MISSSLTRKINHAINVLPQLAAAVIDYLALLGLRLWLLSMLLVCHIAIRQGGVRGCLIWPPISMEVNQCFG